MPFVCGFVILGARTLPRTSGVCVDLRVARRAGLPVCRRTVPLEPCDGPAQRIHEACLARRNCLGKSISTAGVASEAQCFRDGHDL